jgi:O-antigen/teichoic acid export membrane protein
MPDIRRLFQRARRLFSTEPFDTSTSAGRGKERYRRAAWTSVALTGARVIAMAVALITVPLTLHYLGRERYGLWITITSVLTMLAFSDLGIANGLLNKLSAARGAGDEKLGRELVSSAFYVLLAIGAGLSALMLLANPIIPWARVFNLHDAQAVREAGPAATLFAISLFVGLPLSVVSRVRNAAQEGFIDSIWTAVGSILSLVTVLAVIHYRLGLPALVIAIAYMPLLAILLNGVVGFAREYRAFLPRPGAVTRAAIAGVMATGGYFLIIQITGAVAFQSDSFIITQIIGPQAVTDYSVPMRLFMLVPTMLMLLVIPLWPAYAEAATRGDMEWVLVTLRRSLLVVGGLAFVSEAALAGLAVWLIPWWVGSSVHLSAPMLIGGATWAFVYAVTVALSMFMNGLGILRFQAAANAAMVVVNLALSITLTRAIGVSGVVWGSAVSQTFVVLIPTGILLWTRFRKRPETSATPA